MQAVKKGMVIFMICPNCGSNMSEKRKRCERCGTDLLIYKKIYRTSNLYYNNGLVRARVRDLSGAVIALRKSLELNKANTNARNLLGLVYYEMGETVAALSEWVISKHFQSTDNDADDYISRVQSNMTRLDSLNQAIKRYNTALGFAKQGSDDLAIIQLKKVLSLNTNFIRAYQLLSLLLIKTGDNDKAKKYLQKAGKIDVNNTITLRYMKELEVSSAIPKDMDSNPEADHGPVAAIMPLSSYKEDKPNIMAFVNLVIGVILGIAVTAILIIPTIKKNQTVNDGKDIDNSFSITQLEEKNQQIKSLQDELEQLRQTNDQLRTELDNIVVPEDQSVYYVPLFDAVNLYLTELTKSERNRDYSVVTDLLYSIDETKLDKVASVTLLGKLKEETYPKVAREYYKNGYSYYSDGKYSEALVDLKKAMEFDPSDVDAVYFLARAYHRLEDKENAALYYNIVVTEFPDSSRFADATKYLAQVQEQ